MKICKKTEAFVLDKEFPDVKPGDVVKLTGLQVPVDGVAYYLVAKSYDNECGKLLVNLKTGGVWSTERLWGSACSPHQVSVVNSYMIVED